MPCETGVMHNSLKKCCCLCENYCDSHNLELAHLKRKEEKTIYHTMRRLVGHESPQHEWYIVIKPYKAYFESIIMHCMSVLSIPIESTDSMIPIYICPVMLVCGPAHKLHFGSPCAYTVHTLCSYAWCQIQMYPDQEMDESVADRRQQLCRQ